MPRLFPEPTGRRERAEIHPVAPVQPNVDLTAGHRENEPFAPKSWADFKGQPDLKREMTVRMKSARLRGEPVDHVLLLSGPGMGKTSIAKLIAAEMGTRMIQCPTPIEEYRLLDLIRTMNRGDVLFFDEVHQVAQVRGQAEALFPILQDGRSRHGERLPGITVVAATTEGHRLNQPFIDRFPIRPHFSDYTIAEMREIVQAKAESLNITLSVADAHKIAKASDGTPRVATRLIKAVRDLMVVNGTVPAAEEVFKFCGIRPDGLTRDHEEYISTLFKLYPKRTKGGLAYQSGLVNIAKSMGVSPQFAERLEKQLIKRGLIELDGSGRRLTLQGETLARSL